MGPAGLGMGCARCPAKPARRAQQLRPLAAMRQEQADTSCSPTNTTPSSSRRQLLSGVAAGLVAAAALAPAPARAAAMPFLSSTGGKGLLAEEESKLLQLREELEAEALREIEKERMEFNEEEQRTQVIGGRSVRAVACMLRAVRAGQRCVPRLHAPACLLSAETDSECSAGLGHSMVPRSHMAGCSRPHVRACGAETCMCCGAVSKRLVS